MASSVLLIVSLIATLCRIAKARFFVLPLSPLNFFQIRVFEQFLEGVGLPVQHLAGDAQGPTVPSLLMRLPLPALVGLISLQTWTVSTVSSWASTTSSRDFILYLVLILPRPFLINPPSLGRSLQGPRPRRRPCRGRPASVPAYVRPSCPAEDLGEELLAMVTIQAMTASSALSMGGAHPC